MKRPVLPFVGSSFIVAVLIFCGCQPSPGAFREHAQDPQNPAATSNSQRVVVKQQGNVTRQQIENADVSVLIMGNSHTYQMPDYLGELFRTRRPSDRVLIVRAPGNSFLAGHAKNPNTVRLLKRGKWDFVILQAQKYSTSGKYHYPYDGALKLSRIAGAQGTKIIMFPEWSRRGVPEEYLRIDKIHHEIAAKTGAQVAPIGTAWNSLKQSNPAFELHARDGNHASKLGHYLNACIFFAMITGQSPEMRDSQTAIPDSTPSVARKIETSAWNTVAARK